MWLDILAWIIAVLFLIFILIPFIGSIFTNSQSYKMDLKIGATVCGIIVSCVSFVLAVGWAFGKILGAL